MNGTGVRFLKLNRSKRGASFAGYAKALGISETALRSLLSGKTSRPAAKVVAALCREFGEDTVSAWLPPATRVDLVVRAVDCCGTLTRLAKASRVSRGSIDAMLYTGAALSKEQAYRLAEVIEIAPNALPRRPNPQPPAPTERSTKGDSRSVEDHRDRHRYSMRDVMLLLVKLHLAVRDGRIVPPWPCVQDSAPFETILAEWRRCGAGSLNRDGRA